VLFYQRVDATPNVNRPRVFMRPITAGTPPPSDGGVDGSSGAAGSSGGGTAGTGGAGGGATSGRGGGDRTDGGAAGARETATGGATGAGTGGAASIDSGGHGGAAGAAPTTAGSGGGCSCAIGDAGLGVPVAGPDARAAGSRFPSSAPLPRPRRTCQLISRAPRPPDRRLRSFSSPSSAQGSSSRRSLAGALGGSASPLRAAKPRVT
jgi:hypothetical protein